jgi:Na+/melibiose symporter-like transporter
MIDSKILKQLSFSQKCFFLLILSPALIVFIYLMYLLFFFSWNLGINWGVASSILGTVLFFLSIGATGLFDKKEAGQ